MEEDNFNYMNEIVQQGIIVNKSVSEHMCIFRLATNEYTLPNGEITQNYPSIALFGENAEEAKKYNVSDNVRIEGYIQTKKTEDRSIYQKLTGISIKKTNLMMKDDFSASVNDYEKPVNEVRIAGRLIKIFENNSDRIRLIIETKVYNRTQRVNAYYYDNEITVLSGIQTGSYIYMTGHINTRKKNEELKIPAVEMLVVKDIIKIS